MKLAYIHNSHLGNKHAILMSFQSIISLNLTSIDSNLLRPFQKLLLSMI